MNTDYESKLQEKNEKIRLLEEQLGKMRRNTTTYIQVNGELISEVDFRKKILEKTKGIYDSIYVEQRDYKFAGQTEAVPTRVITLQRTICWFDLVPAVAFFSSLFKKDSVYTKGVDLNLIADYVLDSSKTTTDEILSKIYDNTLQAMGSQFKVFDNCKALAESKMSNLDFSIVSGDVPLGTNPLDVKQFLTKYEEVYYEACGNPKKELWVAFWKSKSIVIYIPNECSTLSYIDVQPSGFVTSAHISLGKFLGQTLGWKKF